jgi:hypothetical protein
VPAEPSCASAKAKVGKVRGVMALVWRLQKEKMKRMRVFLPGIFEAL